MPELAEVLYFSRRWRPGLGEKIVRVHLHSAKRVFRGTATHKLQKKLPGATMISCETHGKQMLFRFGRKGWLGIHLGMTGKLLTESPEHSPGKHDHLVLYTRRRALVFQDPRLFGRVRFTCSSQSPPWWSTLPPGILSRDFSLCRLAAVCRRRGHTPLKALLLLQEFFPGIGNWMADEILWQARLDPRTRAGAVDRTGLMEMHRKIRKVSRESIRIIGRDWSDPPRSWLFLHRWSDGGKCPRCQQGLLRRPVGGRTTCWCPSCQKPALPRRSLSS
ncbi:Fpg/Nei family DNA glycosylase [bacterium]|nr:Fpg/Nei family DNA glycosylase [bacterium]